VLQGVLAVGGTAGRRRARTLGRRAVRRRHGRHRRDASRITTEVEYWFRYEAGFSATLDFLGDDDFWVFVNRTLALDLGGLHVPEAGTVTVSDATAATYGLEPATSTPSRSSTPSSTRRARPSS
jgi:fibro-slime domain-containing protein